MRSRLRIIVTGLIAEYPLGGMTWHYLHYLLGLKALGHDVFYFEDSGGWPYNPTDGILAFEHDRNVGYLSGIMSRYELSDRWAYRVQGEGEQWWFGLSEHRRREVVRSADLLINVSGTLDAPEDYRAVQKLVYIDTDPVFIQIRLQRGEERLTQRIRAHDVHFSFGERIGASMPTPGIEWLPTRQPVVVSEWRTSTQPGPAYTTVMNWTSYKSEVHEGRTYGQKDLELRRFLDLPLRLENIRFEIAGGPGHGHPTPRTVLTDNGWRLVDPMRVCPDLDAYREYIQRSRGEWSVAKNAYVRGDSGWFSERSACYLAAGRPVIVQDTGFSKFLPVGEGILTFDDLEGAMDAIRRVESDYSRHTAAALEISQQVFGHESVLSSLLDRASDAR